MIESVGGLDLPLVHHPASRVPLYPHQAAMLDAWDRETTILLASKTGSGKTRAAMLPILRRGEYAVAIYPTNELLRDQVRAVERLAVDEGIKAAIYTPETQNSPLDPDCRLIPLDRHLLDRWQGRMPSRGEPLRRLLARERPRIVFTNPDILFNILAAQYHLDALEPLGTYETVVFDEFHLYHGVEFAHALMMVRLARGLGFFRRVVLLTATPHPEVRDILNRVLRPVDISPPASPPGGPSRTAVHRVYVSPIQVDRESVTQIATETMNARAEILRLRQEFPDDGYIPAVVIVNSVLDAILLEDEIVRRGFDRTSIAVVRGLSNRAVRERAGKLIAIGTSAIEVGVDFDCDLLFFQAFEAASFLQRFGRVGRHRTGRALLFIPPNALAAMAAAPPELDRTAFESLIYTCYPLSDARPWFVGTQLGLLAAASIMERLYETVARDRSASPELLGRFRKKLDSILEEHFTALAINEHLSSRVRAKLEAHRRGVPRMRWFGTYLKLSRFRTSMPSVEVHDWREQSRRGEWDLGTYDVDLGTLLRRGRNIRWHSDVGLSITGIGSSVRVHAGEAAADLTPGELLRTSEHPIRLLQNGLDTPVSDYLSASDHIFAVIPRVEVENQLDWRLTCFEAGNSLMAFDGGALLLVESWLHGKSCR